jgi:ABC-type multidrug transport system ATPase subunit
MRDNVIEVINLSKRFDDKLALREVNLIIPTNKIV